MVLGGLWQGKCCRRHPLYSVARQMFPTPSIIFCDNINIANRSIPMPLILGIVCKFLTDMHIAEGRSLNLLLIFFLCYFTTYKKIICILNTYCKTHIKCLVWRKSKRYRKTNLKCMMPIQISERALYTMWFVPWPYMGIFWIWSLSELLLMCVTFIIRCFFLLSDKRK